MKRILAMLLALIMVLALAACGQSAAPAATEAPAAEEPPAEAPAAEETAEEPTGADGVMSYADYVAAELDSFVTIEAYVQAKQSWWDNKATIYAADEDGAYLLYDANCSAEDYEKLVPGQKIGVQGYKAEWSGEVEIADAVIEILDGDTYIAEPLNVGALLGTEALAEHMNQRICVTNAVVVDKGDGAAFFYNWDNSGEDGDCDLYFDVQVGSGVYTFVVRRYLTEPGSEVYEAVKALNVGDAVDIEGFLYWYEGPQPHITSIVPHEEVKGEGVMTYAEYDAAELETEVTVECYVQAKQSWWDDKVTVYAQDPDGAYFLYELACTEEENALLVPGAKIRVTGYKTEWAGEVEIADASFELLDGCWIAPPVDVTGLLGSDDLAGLMNQAICVHDAVIADKGDGAAFFYNWDNSGEDGDCDLYFDIEVDGAVYTFVVRRYLTEPGGEVYEAVKALNVGDTVDIEGFLYWYEGPQPHITSIVVK